MPFDLSVAPNSLLAEQNTNTVLEVRINRRDHFEGEIRILAEQLPGITIPAVTLAPGQTRTQVPLQVAQNAETGLRSIMIRAEATVQGQSVSTHSTAPVSLTVQPIPLFLTAMLPGSPFFRTDPVRLSAVALPDGTQSEANQTQFVVKVERRGLTGEIQLHLENLPKGVQAQVPSILTNKTEATIQLKVSQQAEIGKEHSFQVVASATHQDRIWRQKTQPILLTLTAQESEGPKPTAKTADKPATEKAQP